MIRPILRIAAVTLAILASACAGPQKTAPAGAVLLFSPNGEPITGGPLGQRPCAEAMGAWFDRVGHGGTLGRDAFLADARAQFARMDLDHDGWITPAELSVYRAPYLPAPDGPEGGLGRNRGAGPTRSSVTQEDPVMSADIGPKFKVGLEEFLTQADEVFTRLDKGHKGLLSREDVTGSCPAKISAGQFLPGGGVG